ncbi:hypothetical protein HETIRDRAFT_424421 [Heterobasidion irregulare TC 32-1]|uniref:Uncharacterized protein n=1 Tax=Heterobasidion irregulare (strain TC 32-1) TaxID=747525 RepID=W4KQP1_HETIT|nr:uncharacterized protein HETIRDRAFT_424421 [Heterobasidion irregulare TC 32-1]ETW87720.1 hypothetical protein HETIRDRAFT_424421 [Heterobasidion irregulare TC 32-1]
MPSTDISRLATVTIPDAPLLNTLISRSGQYGKNRRPFLLAHGVTADVADLREDLERISSRVPRPELLTLAEYDIAAVKATLRFPRIGQPLDMIRELDLLVAATAAFRHSN